MIDKLGLYNIPADAYQADPCEQPSLSAGIVQILNEESPAHAREQHPRLNPAYRNEEASKFDIGTAGHSLLFEGIDRMAVIDPEKYPSKKGDIPKGWTNNAIREARDAARAEGKVPILLDDSVALRLMVDAARKAWADCPDLKGYALDGGKNEWSIFWQEGESWCRCRPDHLSADRRLIVDAKFTELSANPVTFIRQIISMGYDSRGAWYLRGNAATGGPEDGKYVYLIQEQKPPYAAAFIGLAPAFVELGARKCTAALTTWRDCMASGKWPGYGNRIAWAEPPIYAVAQWDEVELARGIEYAPSQLWSKP